MKKYLAENNIELQLDDRIYIRYIGGYNRKHTAEIKGEIKFPGFYNIPDAAENPGFRIGYYGREMSGCAALRNIMDQFSNLCTVQV